VLSDISREVNSQLSDLEKEEQLLKEIIKEEEEKIQRLNEERNKCGMQNYPDP
jgi:hypothetical protein